MRKELLDILSPVTPEEQRLLAGEEIQRDLYMNRDDVIRADKLLETGRLITFRPHTRFAPFPSIATISWKFCICARGKPPTSSAAKN